MSKTADTSAVVGALREIGTEEPPALELAEYLAEETGSDITEAQDRVYDAVDRGLLTETGEGFGGLRLADDQTDDATEPVAEAGSDPEKGGVSGSETTKTDPEKPAETDRQRFDSEPDEYLNDPDFDGSEEAVRQYYRAVRSVYEQFADLDGAPTTGFVGNSGWYRYETRADDDGEAIRHRRAYTFERDFEDLLESLSYDDDDTSWRSFYNIASWKDSEAVYAGATAASYDGFDQGDGLAGYGDMRGFPAWVDLDLNDNDSGSEGIDYKRRRGDLTDDQRETVEAAFQAYTEEFADLVGLEPSEIPIFDSGGGAYIYTPPAVTLLIAERYADDTGPFGDARTLIFEELRQRLHAYGTGTAVSKEADNYGFEGIESRVNDAVDGAAELLSPDWLQNRNRQSKAPLSIHGDHDIAVTPARPVADPEQVEYVPTPVSAVDDELIAHTEAEVDKLVSVPDREELEAMTESFVSTLFAERAETADGWRDLLDQWLADQREEEREAIHAAARDRREKRQWVAERNGIDTGAETSGSAAGDGAAVLSQLKVTKHHSDVIDALENPEIVEITEVVSEYCCTPAASEESNGSPVDERVPWVSGDRGHEITFDPSWRNSGSGQSCAIKKRTVDRQSGEIVTTVSRDDVPNGFVDNGCGGSGDPAVAYALGTGILPTSEEPTDIQRENAAAESLNGKQWLEAVDGLREAGYPIPIYVPEAGSETPHGGQYDTTPLWALRKAAVALGVCDRDDFVEREGDDGGTYLGFGSSDDYNQTLRKLDERGIDTGREPTRDLRSDYLEVDLAAFLDDGDDRDPYTDPEAQLRACLRARDAGQVDAETTPPKLALVTLQRELLGIEPNRDMSDGTKERLVKTYHDLTEADLDAILG
jgi:putative DNA primase/helicase